jgi:hypothetical protein
MPTEGEYPLGHIYLSIPFETPENYRTEFLRFEVAHFDYGYNTIIGRPGLAKFMAIPHYPYMILKMSGPQVYHCARRLPRRHGMLSGCHFDGFHYRAPGSTSYTS